MTPCPCLSCGSDLPQASKTAAGRLKVIHADLYKKELPDRVALRREDVLKRAKNMTYHDLMPAREALSLRKSPIVR
jgi:hypothetical protein